MDLCVISSRVFFACLLSCVFLLHSFLFFSGIQQLCRDFSNHWHSCPVLALCTDKMVSWICGEYVSVCVFLCVLVSIYLLSMVLEQSLLTHDAAQRVCNNLKIYISNISTSLKKEKTVAIEAMFSKVHLNFLATSISSTINGNFA